VRWFHAARRSDRQTHLKQAGRLWALSMWIEAADPWQIAGDNLTPIPQVVKLSVVEGFKGVSPQQREISGNISNNGDSIFLKAGKRYLLYAHQPNRFGTWHTSCSRTRLADRASAELSQLRHCTLK